METRPSFYELLSEANESLGRPFIMVPPVNVPRHWEVKPTPKKLVKTIDVVCPIDGDFVDAVLGKYTHDDISKMTKSEIRLVFEHERLKAYAKYLLSLL